MNFYFSTVAVNDPTVFCHVTKVLQSLSFWKNNRFIFMFISFFTYYKFSFSCIINLISNQKSWTSWKLRKVRFYFSKHFGAQQQLISSLVEQKNCNAHQSTWNRYFLIEFVEIGPLANSLVVRSCQAIRDEISRTIQIPRRPEYIEVLYWLCSNVREH